MLTQYLGQHLHHIRATQQTNLDDLRLKVVDDGLHLLAHHSGRQVVKLLDAQRVLNGDRRDDRCSPSTQLVNQLDVGLNA